MKRIAIVITMCLLLAGCGNASQPVSESVSETEETVQGTEDVTAETVEQKDAEVETAEQDVADSLTEQAEEETALETVEETEAETESEELNEGVVNVTPYETPKTMYATIALNVRRGPSTDYEVVSCLSVAQAVEVTGQADTGWYQFVVDGEPVYASNRYLSETKVELPVLAPAQTAQAAVPVASVATVAPAGVIMVGDSRCVQMQAAVGGGGCSWICENSKEYTWFSEVAIPKFDPYVGYGTKVVINMGVNDPEHYRQYAELINAKAAEWSLRGATTYLVSVNPVWENPYTSQEQVDTFNANVPGMLVGVRWIDTSSWLTMNGYCLRDGLHYDDPTYVNIFNLIMGSL